MPKLILTLWHEEPETARHEIVTGLLAEGEVGLLTGQPKSGKSAVALALAAAVATGEDFLGRPVQSGDVVYFALERRRSVRRRIAALGLPQSARLWLPKQGLSLVDDVANIIEGIEAGAPDIRLIVVDTLARATIGMDENSARDMGFVAQAMARIGEAFPCAALLLIHHTGKDGSSLRGSSALLGAVDVEIRAEIRKAACSIRVVNANEVAEDQRIDFILEAVEMTDGGTAICAVAPPSDGRAAIRNTNDQRRAEAEARALEALAYLPVCPFTQAEAKIALTEAGIAEGSDAARKKQTKRLTDRLRSMGKIADQDGKMIAERS